MKCMSIAHEKFGKLEWSELIDPIVELVRNGVFVTQELLNFTCSKSRAFTRQIRAQKGFKQCNHG